MKPRLPHLKHLLEAGTSSPDHLLGDISHPPPACPQDDVPGDHPTCEKKVIVWIGVWVTVALRPMMHRNQVCPELGGRVIVQGNDEAAGEMLCGSETA